LYAFVLLSKHVCFAIVSNITISWIPWIFNDCHNPWTSLSYDFFHIFIIFALTSRVAIAVDVALGVAVVAALVVVSP